MNIYVLKWFWIDPASLTQLVDKYIIIRRNRGVRTMDTPVM